MYTIHSVVYHQTTSKSIIIVSLCIDTIIILLYPLINDDQHLWWADTGRQYSQGDIEKTCTTSEQYVPKDTFKETCFPRAYAKYGTK